MLSRSLPSVLLLGSVLTLSACADDAAPVDETSGPAVGPSAQTPRLRVDRIARDVPYTGEDLVRNFRRVAFGSEYSIRDGRTSEPSPDAELKLRRWEGPVRYVLTGWISETDRAQAAETAARLAAATGLSITPVGIEKNPELEIRFLSEQDRAEQVAEFAGPRKDSPLAELFLAWAGVPGWSCAGEFYYRDVPDPQAHEIQYGVIYIRDETRGLHRQACIEEEFSQILGLTRDHPLVRPSIFNDDEEFALLTRHDEQLLRILYDPRLRPGMTPDEAMPLVRDVVLGMVPGG